MVKWKFDWTFIKNPKLAERIVVWLWPFWWAVSAGQMFANNSYKIDFVVIQHTLKLIWFWCLPGLWIGYLFGGKERREMVLWAILGWAVLIGAMSGFGVMKPADVIAAFGQFLDKR